MNKIDAKSQSAAAQKETAGVPPQDVVGEKNAFVVSNTAEARPKATESEIPAKKRKTRRGKSKRRHPYTKNGRKSNKLIKPEAPHNSNQFLLEDHGDIEELDENLKHVDQSSITSAGRTRDSSFSMDSEKEFYSSPDDEEQFLIKDFDDQYESIQAERLQSMSKDELIQEYLLLERKVELLSKRLRKKGQCEEVENSTPVLQNEIERLTVENEALKRENAVLQSSKTYSSDSEDSETDSDDSCSSSSSSSSSCHSKKTSSPLIDYTQTNGHSCVESV